MRNITSVLIAAAALVASAACTVHDASIPPVAGPSELSKSLRLTATPSVVPQDGATQSRILIQSFDTAGAPIGNLTVQLALQGAGSLSANTVVTGSDGRASVNFVPPLQNGPSLTATVHANPAGFAGDFVVSIQLTGNAASPPMVPNSPVPTAEFTSSPATPIVSQSVFFNASASKAVVGHAIVGYRWDFGDGTIDTTSGVSASHQYALAGTYNVSLTVTDDAGAQATKVSGVPVTQGTPKAAFTFVVTNPATHTVTFDGGGSTAVAPFQITNWAWTFGDGASGTGSVTSHPYAAAGNIPVSLTVTDSNGKTATVTQVVAVP